MAGVSVGDYLLVQNPHNPIAPAVFGRVDDAATSRKVRWAGSTSDTPPVSLATTRHATRWRF